MIHPNFKPVDSVPLLQEHTMFMQKYNSIMGKTTPITLPSEAVEKKRTRKPRPVLLYSFVPVPELYVAHRIEKITREREVVVKTSLVFSYELMPQKINDKLAAVDKLSYRLRKSRRHSIWSGWLNVLNACTYRITWWSSSPYAVELLNPFKLQGGQHLTLEFQIPFLQEKARELFPKLSDAILSLFSTPLSTPQDEEQEVVL